MVCAGGDGGGGDDCGQACNGDHQTISYGCRALYVLDKHQQSFKVKEKNESEASGADGQTATLPVVASSAAAAAEEGDEMALSPEDRQFCEKGRERMEAYADELIPVLIDIIRKYVAPSPMLCVSCACVTCVCVMCVSLTWVGPLKEQAGDGGLPLGRGLHAATHLPPLLPLLVHSLDPPQDGHLRRVPGTPPVTMHHHQLTTPGLAQQFTDVLTELLADTVVEIQVCQPPPSGITGH